MVVLKKKRKSVTKAELKRRLAGARAEIRSLFGELAELAEETAQMADSIGAYKATIESLARDGSLSENRRVTNLMLLRKNSELEQNQARILLFLDSLRNKRIRVPCRSRRIGRAK